jgi:hypothetical protein
MNNPTFIFLLSLLMLTTCVIAQNNLQPIAYRGKMGVADQRGLLTVPALYDDVQPTPAEYYDREKNTWKPSERQFFKVRLDNQYGVFDGAGKKVLNTQYSDVQFGYADKGSSVVFAARYQGLYAIFNPKGEQLTPFKYHEVWLGDFGEGNIALARKDNKRYWLIDTKGKEHKY